MPKNLDLKTSVSTALVAGVSAGVLAFILSLLFPTPPHATVGAFPILGNFLEFVTIVGGVLAGVFIMEERTGKDLYKDSEVAAGSLLIALVGVFTVGLGVPPFNLSPYPVAVAATVLVETFLFVVFALAFARSYEFL